MTLEPVVPIPGTDELEQTIDFYVGTLGSVCGDRNDEWGWAAIYDNNGYRLVFGQDVL